MATRVIIAPGQRFGRLTVLGAHPQRTHGGSMQWMCRCDCGRERVIISYALRNRTRSCGCLWREAHLKHGLSTTTEYGIWAAMNRRCGNPTAENYQDYGGRGITVCSEWESFTRFLSDMGSRPTPDHTLDRLDNDGPYSKNNCAWRTRTEQNRNTRSNRLLIFNGRTMPVATWAEELGFNRMLIYNRLRQGWTAARALTEPIRASKRRVG